MKDFKTEAGALKLICPFLPTLTEDEGEEPRNCVASSCMAWRWSHQDTGVNDPPTGFCGAAVSPKYI